MNKRTVILLNVLLLAILLKLSFWADQRSFEAQGVTRMVTDPHGTLYLLTSDEIVRVSSDGDVLAKWPLAGMGITEPVADLAFGLDGQLLVGLIESQEIRRYTSDGKFVGTVSRPSSPERVGVPGQHLRNFKFARDDRSGTLYVADSNHHRIQIYASGAVEARILTSPSGKRPVVTDGGEEGSEDDQPPAMDPHRPFRFPNSLAVDGDRLYTTDTDNHRIVVFHLDGTLDRIIPTTLGARNLNIFPVHFARMDDRLFVINRGPMFFGGEVVVLDPAFPGSRPLYPRGLAIDPLDIVVLGDDVLIADGETRNILRYSSGGFYLGFFGRPSLQELLLGKERTHRGFLFLRVLSIGGMVMVLLAFLALKRSERQERTEQGLPDVHRTLPALQEFLGPMGSSRRNILLWLMPGIGYIAAGRLLRAIILVPPLVLVVLMLLISFVMLVVQGVTMLPVVMFTAVISGGLWAGVVLDGMRLNEGWRPRTGRFDPLAWLKTAGSLLLTVSAGIASQLAWEYLKRAVPEVTLTLQGLVGDVMLRGGLTDEHAMPFDAASVVGRFLGWGGAVAGMFGALAWRLGQGREKIGRAAVIGLFCGMLSWIFTAAIPGSMLGGAFYEPLSLGLLVGLAAFLLFRGPLVTLPVVPLAIAAAWIGNMANLVLIVFLRVGIPFVMLPGASQRITSIITEAVCIHLAALAVIQVMEKRSHAPAATHAGPERAA